MNELQFGLLVMYLYKKRIRFEFGKYEIIIWLADTKLDIEGLKRHLTLNCVEFEISKNSRCLAIRHFLSGFGNFIALPPEKAP